MDLEEGENGKDVDGEGEGDEEDEIEEDPDKRNRLDGYYVAMGIILGLCILGTLAYMTGKRYDQILLKLQFYNVYISWTIAILRNPLLNFTLLILILSYYNISDGFRVTHSTPKKRIKVVLILWGI